MRMYWWVALGSGLGGMARYGCTELAAAWLGGAFPWGTVAVNVLGSFAIGFFAAFSGTESRVNVPAEARVFVMVGLCGGFTTFSSFSLQTLELLRDAAWLAAGANAGGSVALCLLAAWLGHASAAALSRVPRGR
ncbi:fluoride efflux transporter CrcB [Caldovatus aquaticus]|uniref:Fluoride-specific ion channel FluC n=1 Tax=Caldovatus aquaticus TaxID=2865671 RepID=A0ABS7F8L5_9PROT|nr:fluoride efflux transporter CrcB [Caldovatus aquaticus]MBW8271150.1 fluoride efflux transporter CrcB [Caldovatus aquaticus]